MRAFFLVCTALALAACDRTPVPDPATPDPSDQSVGEGADLGPSEEHEEAGHAHTYSPFALQMRQAGLPFSIISFKDVGMSIPEEDRAFVYESIAQGLAAALDHPTAPMSSEVQHLAAIADPNNHLHCESRHIYVDLWREAAGWGYSLWSGCGADDEFAHRAVSAPTDHGAIASYEPLTRDIADRLRDAVRTGCFTRRC